MDEGRRPPQLAVCRAVTMLGSTSPAAPDTSPAITSCTPIRGPAAGGTTATVNGTELEKASSVGVGSTVVPTSPLVSALPRPGTELRILDDGIVGAGTTSAPPPAARPRLVSRIVDAHSRQIDGTARGDEGPEGRGAAAFAPLATIRRQVPSQWPEWRAGVTR